MNVNPTSIDKNWLELVGKSADLRIEKLMDKLCRRVSAVTFIQKFYRGHLVRKQVLQQK